MTEETLEKAEIDIDITRKTYRKAVSALAKAHGIAVYEFKNLPEPRCFKSARFGTKRIRQVHFLRQVAVTATYRARIQHDGKASTALQREIGLERHPIGRMLKAVGDHPERNRLANNLTQYLIQTQ